MCAYVAPSVLAKFPTNTQEEDGGKIIEAVREARGWRRCRRCKSEIVNRNRFVPTFAYCTTCCFLTGRAIQSHKRAQLDFFREWRILSDE